MRQETGIVGATMLFGPQAGEPDLLLAMQFLLDDLRAEGRRIAAIKLTASTLRLRADPYELVLTIAPGPLPVASMHGLLRPPTQGAPDFARVHLGRMLRIHQHAVGFMVRRRGAPITDPEEAARIIAREGQLCLIPVIEAAPPALLIWQPGGLVLTPDEFRRARPDLLLQPGDPAAPLTLTAPERLGLARPGGEGALAPSPFSAPAPGSRAERAETRSLGRLFGKTAPRALALPQIDRSAERIAAALRDTDPRPSPRAEGTRNAAARAFWAALLPQIGGFGGLS